MYNQIKKIYKSKVTEDIQGLNKNDYYFFYQDATCKNSFAIKKSITASEYELLKNLFIEKKEYAIDKKQNQIYKYLYENSEYPFKEEFTFIIYLANENDEETINKVISDIYKDSLFIKYLNYTIVFSKELYNIKAMFQAFIMDLGYEIIMHEGFRISKTTKGEDLLIYLNYFNNFFSKSPYSNICQMTIQANNNNFDIIRIIKDNVLVKILPHQSLVDLINTYFKNNLNVSLTSKLIYMHRNSLLNKLEQIEKLTSLNIQNFQDAYAMKILLDFGKKND